MTTFAFPSITPTTNTFELVANTRTFQSPLTNAIQTTSRKGSLWRISMQFANLSGAERKTMQAFLAKLNGQQHRFTVQDHSYTLSGGGGGTLQVNGGTQSGTSLVCDGATASVSNYLKAGDYIAFNNELHMVVADTDSDGSGNVTVSIAPPIRKTPADDTIVEYTVPKGVFILSGPASWDTQPSITSSFNIEAFEDVLA